MLKDQKGVTLVALVVIIVLLIVVVAVAVSFIIVNNNGASEEDFEAYTANTDYKIDTFMNETEVKLQEIEENVSTQEDAVNDSVENAVEDETTDENQIVNSL